MDEDEDALVMFTDSYDVILNADASTITQRFQDEFQDKHVVFGAEPFCWPDKTLANKYPQVNFSPIKVNKKRFLNSAAQNRPF